MVSTTSRDIGFKYHDGGVDHSFVLQQSCGIDLAKYQLINRKDWRLAFYELNYTAIAAHIQEKTRKIWLGDRTSRRCRFCVRTEQSGQASFRLEAHGFPKLIGNRTLFSNYECDDCNTYFGSGIENQLGIYLKPYRALAAIRGHKGYPEIKSEKDGWRIWRDLEGLHVHHASDRRIAEFNEHDKTLEISLPRDAYRPLDVYKAFVKMALTLAPEDEVQNFKTALTWIKGGSDLPFIPPTVSTTFVEGPPVEAMSALLLRRLTDGRELPYLMAYGKRLSFPSYPMPPELNGERHRVHFEEVDLSESRIMKDEVVRYDFSYNERIKTNRADED